MHATVVLRDLVTGPQTMLSNQGNEGQTPEPYGLQLYLSATLSM